MRLALVMIVHYLWLLGHKLCCISSTSTYHNASSGNHPKNRDEDASYTTGDVVGCGIDMDKAKLKPDGCLEPQQTVTVYFTKNGKRVRYDQKEQRI